MFWWLPLPPPGGWGARRKPAFYCIEWCSPPDDWVAYTHGRQRWGVLTVKRDLPILLVETTMSVRQECERRLDDAKLKIKNANSELANLTRKRDEAIAADNARDAIRLKDQLKWTQEQVEDWTITKLALEVKVRVYERNELGAAKLRDEVTQLGKKPES